MKAVISYSLFGFGKERHRDCFDFHSYLRGLNICIRMNSLIYPDWNVVLNLDESSYNAYKDLFSRLREEGFIKLKIWPDTDKLCEGMLWRMSPIFDKENEIVLCRDLDSPATFRERQAVQYWMDNGKVLHAITDSVSHNLPLLGGMIGMRAGYFRERVGASSWGEFRNMVRCNLSEKGSDQIFLNDVIYPIFARHGSDSITQHYFNGHPNTFLSDFHTCTCPPTSGHSEKCPNNYTVPIPDDLKETNTVCGHIGASGWYETALFKFLRKHSFSNLINIEKEYQKIFYWTNDLT